MHTLVLGATLFVVTYTHGTTSHTASAQLLSQRQGYGSVMDATAAATAADEVAKTASLAVAQDADKQAKTLSAEVAIPTSGSEALSKVMVADTAGDASRSIEHYTVQSGDTLSGIAVKYGITTSTIKWANNLSDADSLKPGETLVILPVSGLLYTVQSGDTADSLANKYQANAAQILSYNNAEVKGLTPGEQIIIPDGVKQDPKPSVNLAAVTATVQSFTPRLTYYSGSANGYAYGYCTWYVATRRSIPSFWGNANAWYYNAQISGFSVGSRPIPGAIAWTPAGYYGHVAYVESVSGNMVTVSEMNYNGNWGRVTYRTVPASTFPGYIY